MINTPRMLHHNRVQIALHTLAEGEGTPLLVLHGLGERTMPPRDPWSGWPGPVYGIDFTGHGESTVPAGGGYTAEVLMSDVDVALAEVGPATILGRGLGGYVGLLIAGARPDLVLGVVIDDGPGLAGGGSGPPSGSWYAPGDIDGSSPDPFALYELSNDVRPADYVNGFVHLLMSNSAMDQPLIVTARNRPPWLTAVAAEPGVVVTSADAAFKALAQP